MTVISARGRAACKVFFETRPEVVIDRMSILSDDAFYGLHDLVQAKYAKFESTGEGHRQTKVSLEKEGLFLAQEDWDRAASTVATKPFVLSQPKKWFLIAPKYVIAHAWAIEHGIFDTMDFLAILGAKDLPLMRGCDPDSVRVVPVRPLPPGNEEVYDFARAQEWLT